MSAVTTVKAISGNPTRNNGATVLFTSTVGVVTKPLGRTGFAKMQYVYDTIPAADYAVKAVSGSSAFGTMIANKYIIMGITREIGGISSRVLLGAPRSNSIRPIAYREFSRTLQTSGKIMNYYTGRFTVTPDSQLDTYGNDHAARPTIAVPGEFVVRWGTRSDPLYKDYRERTSA